MEIQFTIWYWDMFFLWMLAGAIIAFIAFLIREYKD